MRKNSFDQFKKYPSSSSAKTPHYAMAQSLAVRFKSRQVNWRLPYHSYAFFSLAPFVRRHSRGLLEDCRFNINCQKGIMPYVNQGCLTTFAQHSISGKGGLQKSPCLSIHNLGKPIAIKSLFRIPSQSSRQHSRSQNLWWISNKHSIQSFESLEQ